MSGYFARKVLLTRMPPATTVPYNMLPSFNNVGWTLLGLSALGIDYPAPNGTSVDSNYLSCLTLVQDTASSGHGIYYVINKAASSLTYRATVYVRAPPGFVAEAWAGLYVSDGGGNAARAYVNLTTWAFTSGTDGTGYSVVSASFTPVRSGWFKIELIFTTNTAAAFLVLPSMTTDGATLSFVGSSSKTISIALPELIQIF